MVWWPFAPKPERADTSEVTDLYSGAPPLYSTPPVVKKEFGYLTAEARRTQSKEFLIKKIRTRRTLGLCGEY